MSKEKYEEKSEENDEEDCSVMCCHDGGHVHAEVISTSPRAISAFCFKGRGNVVMTRLNDDDLSKIDALVEVEVFKSRSEATAFFIKEGMNARKDLFDKVMDTVNKIKELKEQAKESLGKTQET